MKDAYVFGYGSLVNTDTHSYSNVGPATLNGWRREWRHIQSRSVAFLTIVRDANSMIEGVVARVSPQDWAALDRREQDYLRDVETPFVIHQLESQPEIWVYHAPQSLHPPSDGTHPILLSYLDVVLQGFHAHFGPEGVQRFFETTDGWDAPILNDRAAPRYSRAQVISQNTSHLIDEALQNVGATLI